LVFGILLEMDNQTIADYLLSVVCLFASWRVVISAYDREALTMLANIRDLLSELQERLDVFLCESGDRLRVVKKEASDIRASVEILKEDIVHARSTSV